MKYIFRFTIVLHYTENPQKLTSADLLSALASNHFPYADRWEELVDYTKPCIEALIATLSKDNLADSHAEAIREHIDKLKIEFDLDGLVQIWESEKQKVLSKILKDSVKTGEKFNSISWQVYNNIGNQKNVQVQPHALLTVGGAQGKVQVEMGKKGMKKMLKVLGSAEEFLDHHLS